MLAKRYRTKPMNKMMITINKPKLMKNAGKLGDLFSSTYHF